MKDLEDREMKKLLIDVRDNGGGSLTVVNDICNLIIPNTKPYLFTKRGNEIVEKFQSKLVQAKSYPIIGIQNENSASASEILMGALKEVNNSEIIGTNSYGTPYFISNTSSVIKDLLNDNRYQSIQKENKNTIPLIDWKYLLFLIAISLTTEWFLRKYNGLI